jgi:SAM-dependent methyltransferase
MKTQEHYDNHLSSFYSWMIGDFGKATASQRELFEKYGIAPRASGIAIDLGCGTGLQSLALSELGFDVHAVDFSLPMLGELRARCPRIETRQGDLRDLEFAKALAPEVIVCMGDTLTHLDSKSSVESLIQDCASLLQPDARLILSFRDLSRLPALADRFIPVRADEDRILTCFLEDAGEKVRVFDLLYEKQGPAWTLKSSHYEKLKLAAGWVRQLLQSGFEVSGENLPGGQELIVGRKRAAPGAE